MTKSEGEDNIAEVIAEQTAESVEEELKTISSRIFHLEQQMSFARGIALGLFYGIIGNILISHYYGVFEGLVTRKLDSLFATNLLVLTVALALIVVVSVGFYNRMKMLKREQKALSKEGTKLFFEYLSMQVMKFIEER